MFSNREGDYSPPVAGNVRLTTRARSSSSGSFNLYQRAVSQGELLKLAGLPQGISARLIGMTKKKLCANILDQENTNETHNEARGRGIADALNRRTVFPSSLCAIE